VPPTPLSSGHAAGHTRFGGLVTDGRPTEDYDFLRPPKLAREHLRTLQLVCETFAHRLGVLLTSRLRVLCRAVPGPIEQVAAGEHFARIDTEPMLIAPLSLEPLPGAAALEMSLNTAMTCIDHRLGGSGGPQPQRQLSDIETPLLREVLTACLGELAYAFEDVVRIAPELGQLEYNPQLVQLGGPTEALVVAAFDLTVGDVNSSLSLCLPLQSVLPELQRHHEQAAVSPGERAARQVARDLVSARLQDVPVAVRVVFNSIRLRSDQLLDLRPGDVVPLDHRVDLPLDITTADRSFGRAVATQRGQRLACQVVSTDEELPA
jgi:flagellar motor switch protein FliM